MQTIQNLNNLYTILLISRTLYQTLQDSTIQELTKPYSILQKSYKTSQYATQLYTILHNLHNFTEFNKTIHNFYNTLHNFYKTKEIDETIQHFTQHYTT